MAMKARSLPVLGPQGFVNLAYWEWEGPPGAPVVVCVHGLTRNGRDFDALAAALSGQFRVICPDMPGRGASDWLASPAGYNFTFYVAAIGALWARLDVSSVDWVGTSMGGLIGILFAGLPNAPVRRMVLNDVGPFLPKEGLARIGETRRSRPGLFQPRRARSVSAPRLRAVRPAQRHAMAPACRPFRPDARRRPAGARL